MEFYLNEISLQGLPANNADLDKVVRRFVKLCIMVKKIGFRELRSDIYLLDYEVKAGYPLSKWVSDRSTGDIDLKRRFRDLSLKFPLISEDELNSCAKTKWSEFTHKGHSAVGLGAAFLKSSIAISFHTHLNWELHKVQDVVYEYIDDSEQEINKELISVNNISRFRHVLAHRVFGQERLKTIPVFPDWVPLENHLPNEGISTPLLNVQKFYNTFQGKTRIQKTAEARALGKQVAELNFFEYSKGVSKANKGAIRDIYVSKNTTGRKIYLSIDVEKGAFEVCEDDGTHLKEILFNGKQNGGQKLDHSIRVK